ncbi:RWD domain-containing protein [Colletotrichum graminicola]|uniref:RBR-type E3 ubiquitin transferase n=1 Tax=Colletotrichum graminicola (strain M1.001 / M2 / FGSC 10212) TaxID=645133 RepID=E3QAY2_COLGM|nr:RWD domain-containing protein [Colletotrichum graminicola M1.001]EFQ28020.1 RWD domain-containing protein [Colletotrichum graminicola M1.001]WDK12023.1 RWD domain-containing protein [Colletotrichum graminicola]
MDADSDDLRQDELSSLQAIFPEIEPDDQRPFCFTIQLPVRPAKPVTVAFPAAPSAQDTAAAQLPGVEPRVDSHELSHLPAVVVRMELPEGYPSERPPGVSINTSPPWLTRDVIKKLEDDGPRLWEEMGRDMIAFTYIDHVQQAADDVFDMVDGNGTLEIDPSHKIAILDYDIEAARAAFEKETFDCGICLDPKKGFMCHKMLDCGHIFCIQCLQEFYNNAITEGDLATVRCLAPNCSKERAEAGQVSASGKKRKVKTSISPSELLQIGLPQEMVTRYVTLKYKNELESDKDTIYCPRSWCQGAARSKKHRKPEGLEMVEASGEDTEDDEGAGGQDDGGKGKKKQAFDRGDLLAICEDCGFAFCSRCYQSWHGEFYRCTPKRDTGELSAEEQASIDYINLHTTPCPTCGVTAQKSHGCNHMICFRCASHFCYLCSAWLDPRNPYAHFNEQPDGRITSCFMRLWELEGGDGDNVGIGFAGGARQAQAQDEDDDEDEGVVEIVDLVPEIEEPDDSDSDTEADDVPQPPPPPAGGVAREGPLVLRIGADPAPRGGRGGGGAAGVAHGPVPPAAPPAPANPARRGGPPVRGGRGGRGNRGADVRGGRRQNQQRNQRLRVPVVGRNGEIGIGVVDADALDAAQEAWIRRFVQMALDDEEEDSDEG